MRSEPNVKAMLSEDSENCSWKFTHPKRPRNRCRLPAGASGYCVFHSQDEREAGNEFGIRLAAEVEKEDHWLEGACIKADLINLQLDGANLPSANFGGRRISQVTFQNATLENANFNDAILDGVSFGAANLRYAIFDVATFSGRESSVDFRQADLGGASFDGAKVRAARLLGAKFSEPTAIGVLLETPSFEMESAWWDEAAAILATIGKRAAEDWDFVRAERAAFQAMTCRHRLAIKAGTLSRRGWWAEWGLPTLRSGFRGFGWMLNRAIWGYGLKPSRVFSAMLATVACAFVIFGCLGVNRTGGNSRSWFLSLFDSAIISVNSFVGFSIGPLAPHQPFGELFAGLEAWLGAILLALFLVTLAGKYLRRFGG